MTHTLTKVYLHILFSTKRREPFIGSDMESHLFNYVSSVCKSLECRPLKIGGHKDHVHILCMLHKDLSVLELIEEVKIASSRWVKNKFPSVKNFSWQQGFASFSVSEDEIATLSHYIETQEQHHTLMKYEDELRRLLIANEVEFDETAMLK
jgi:putative transposase